MIKNDLKEKLGKDWRSKFAHRDCDQADYEFGEFKIDGKKIGLVLNPNTLDIMDFYYDDFDGKISINDFIKGFGLEEQDNRKYYIDREYNYYSIGKGNKSTIKSLFDCKLGFRERYISTSFNSKTRKVKFQIHRLIAFMFVPNPNPELYNIVNHKDRNKNNFRKENLEWCDTKWNNASNNRTRTLRYTYRIVGTTAEYTYLELKDNKYRTSGVLNAIKKNKKYRGVFWERIDKTLLNYISKHPIRDDEWYDDNNLHDFGKHKVRANSCGVLEIDGRYTVGSFDSEKKYYNIVIDHKYYAVSKLIFEIINHKLVDEGKVIDHIIPVSEDDTNNSVENLREVSQKENMNNPLTKEKISTSLRLY